jgi:hypothetical protein
VQEKPTRRIRVRRARKVGAPATLDSFSPLLEKKEREKQGKPWMMVITWTNWNLMRELLGMGNLKEEAVLALREQTPGGGG